MLTMNDKSLVTFAEQYIHNFKMIAEVILYDNYCPLEVIVLKKTHRYSVLKTLSTLT